MPRITIKEIDASTTGVLNTTTNAVYIPGFASQAKSSSTDKDNSLEGLPTLFEDVIAFEDAYGKSPVSSKNGVRYDAILEGYSDENNAFFIDVGGLDKSYIMAKELLNMGIPVYYECVKVIDDTDGKEGITASDVLDLYEYLFGVEFDTSKSLIIDKGDCVFRFLTTGGYPVFTDKAFVSQPEHSVSIGTGMMGSMAVLAATRGDVVAIADYFEYIKASKEDLYSKLNAICIQSKTSASGEDAWSYTSMFAPYATYTTKSGDQTMPASLGYLLAYAASVQNNPTWYAAAGVNRGAVPNMISISRKNVITNAMAESMYPDEAGVAINCITNIKPYGYVIWGNRTLKVVPEGLKATSFLNVRLMSNEIKRQMFVSARKRTFEQNTDILWINFKSDIMPLLDKMSTGGGITGYQFVKQKTSAKATLKARLIIYCVEAVENFDLEIELRDSNVDVSEN